MNNISSMGEFLQRRQARDRQTQEEMTELLEKLDGNIRSMDEAASELSAIVLSLLLEASIDTPADNSSSIMYRPMLDAEGTLIGYRIINRDLQQAAAEAFCRVESLQQTDKGTTLDVVVLRQYDETLPARQVWMLAQSKSDPTNRTMRALMEEPVDNQEGPQIIQLSFAD